MPSKISALHRELYELPWDRRRFSAHRARVQSAGLLDCLLMFYHFQQMSTLCDSQCECGLLFVFVFVMHFYIVQVPGLTVVLHRVVTSLISGNCSHPLAVIKPLFTFMQMEFAAISVNCSHPDVLFPLFFCKWSIMAPIQMNSFLFHANGVCLHFFHFYKKSIVLT